MDSLLINGAHRLCAFILSAILSMLAVAGAAPVLASTAPGLSGFYMMDRVVLNVAGTPDWQTQPSAAVTACGRMEGRSEAEVVMLEHTGTQLTFRFASSDFAGAAAESGRIVGGTRISSHGEQRTVHASGEEHVRSHAFEGTYYPDTRLIEGMAEEVNAVTAIGGTSVARCTLEVAVTLTPMPEVNAGLVLSPSSNDGGYARTTSTLRSSDQPAFEYHLTNTDGRGGFQWHPQLSTWTPTPPVPSSLVLTAAGWVELPTPRLLNAPDGQTRMVHTGPDGTPIAAWRVRMYAMPIVNRPLADLVHPRWIRDGLTDPDALFTHSDARAVAVYAQREHDLYEIRCEGGSRTGSTQACANWLATDWPAPRDQNPPTPATALTDVIHPRQATMSTPLQSVWTGRHRQSARQVRAFLQGTDISGTEGSTGIVTFYTDAREGTPPAPLIDETGNAVVSTWTVRDPQSNGLDLVLEFEPPAYVRRHVELPDDAETFFVAAVPDGDGQVYLRTGSKSGAGDVQRTAGINRPALTDALALFNPAD